MLLRLALLVSAFCSIGAIASAQDPWQPADVMQPADLAARLRNPAAPQPKMFYVGFGVLYRSKHIPGSVFTGPTSKQEGLELLRSAVIKLPRQEEIVIYCGCCPWEKCPNLRPAFVMLHELGFKKVRVVALPTSFLRDWIEKGYPVELGEAAAK